MPVRALVVGCDSYPLATGSDLTGAVADALAFRAWLLGPGGVRPDELIFLAGPSPGGATIGPDVAVDGPATTHEFTDAIDRLEAAGPPTAGRAWVYFAGHGCRTDPLNTALSDDALLFADAKQANPASGAIGMSPLLGRLDAMWFTEYVVITDACRDYPFPRSFQTGSVGTDPMTPAGRPFTPRGFVFQAALPGATAAGGGNGKGGLFTRCVLQALSAESPAGKVYDETQDPPVYEVRWSTLTTFVEAALPHQPPRALHSSDTVLARFPDGTFDPVDLTVAVSPDDVAAAPGLTVTATWSDPSQPLGGTSTTAGPAPVSLVVPPRRQRIVVHAGPLGFKQVWRDVYAPTVVDVAVDPAVDPAVGLDDEAAPRGVLEQLILRSAWPVTVTVTVRSARTALVVVEDAAGEVVDAAMGEFHGELAPGVYTAVAVMPRSPAVRVPFEARGRFVDVPVEVEPAPPAPIEAALADRLNVQPGDGFSGAALLLAAAYRRGATTLAVAAPFAFDPGELFALADFGGEIDVDELGPEGWVASVRHLDVPGRRVEVALADHRLNVPLVPEGATALYLPEHSPLQVALWGGTERLSLDAWGDVAAARAQEFAATGRGDLARLAAGVAVTAPDAARSPVVRALADPGRDELDLLASSAPDWLRRFLVGHSPWAVYLDAPFITA